MAALIFTVFGIAAIAYIMAASLPEPQFTGDALQLVPYVSYGLLMMEQATSEYFRNNIDPETGEVIFPGNGLNMKMAITPTFGFLPANVSNEITWDMITGTMNGLPSVGLCVKPLSKDLSALRNANRFVKTQLPNQTAVLGDECGATTNTPNGAYLTYWMALKNQAVDEEEPEVFIPHILPPEPTVYQRNRKAPAFRPGM